MSSNDSTIVWLAEYYTNYKDSYIVGIFSSEEKAQAAIDNNAENYYYSDEWRITEYTLDEDYYHAHDTSRTLRPERYNN